MAGETPDLVTGPAPGDRRGHQRSLSGGLVTGGAGTHTQIIFVAQCWWEAGLTDDLA